MQAITLSVTPKHNHSVTPKHNLSVTPEFAQQTSGVQQQKKKELPPVAHQFSCMNQQS